MPDGQYIQIGIIQNTFTVGLVTLAICVHQGSRTFLTANIQYLVSVKIKDQPRIEPELPFIENASVNGQLHPLAFDSSIICPDAVKRSEEHTSELPSLMRLPYAVFC